jgi:hypothetical protein
MKRQPNTTRDGSPFDPDTVEAVWRMSMPDPERVSFHRDRCGALINRYLYGSKTPFGWEIDHLRPVVLGGTDDPDNLQPLHWENNRQKGDAYPEWECLVTDADDAEF